MNCKLLQKTDKTFSFKHPSTTKEDVTNVFNTTTRNDNRVRGEVKNNILSKSWDVVHQYAAFLERGVQCSTRVRKVLVETRQANPLGRSMIEMLGVLAIIGVLSVGGIAGFSKMLAHQKIMQAQEQINAIAAKLSTIGAEASSFSGLNNKTAIKFGAIPSEAIVDAKAGTLQNPFKGDIQIVASTNGTAYVIVYNEVPKDACMNLATQDWGGKNSSFLRIFIGRADKTLTTNNIRSNAKGIADLPYNSVISNKNLTIKNAEDEPMSPAEAAVTCQCIQKHCTMGFVFN